MSVAASWAWPRDTVAVEKLRGGIGKRDDEVHNRCDPSIWRSTRKPTRCGRMASCLTCAPAKELPLAQRYFLF
jgi:urease subunit alpha